MPQQQSGTPLPRLMVAPAGVKCSGRDATPLA